MNFSLIIPAYNEEKTITQTIVDLKKYISENNLSCEIIVVNDGSTDTTGQVAGQIENIKLINHPYNKGYGASVKSAVAVAQYDWIMTYDSDGQHKTEYIKQLVDSCDGFDMVVGARQGYQGPAIRQPGKKIIRMVAEYLVEQKIADLNSGFRLIKKDYFKRYSHLLPQRFSWTTTITLAFMKEGLSVKYVPITINKRQGGKSSVKANDAFRALMLIVRMIVLFSPLRIFAPVSIFLFGLGILFFAYDVYSMNMSEITVFTLISSLLIFFFGLIADQVAAIRREIRR